jgi:hypothetical protein
LLQNLNFDQTIVSLHQNQGFRCYIPYRFKIYALNQFVASLLQSFAVQNKIDPFIALNLGKPNNRTAFADQVLMITALPTTVQS